MTPKEKANEILRSIQKTYLVPMTIQGRLVNIELAILQAKAVRDAFEDTASSHLPFMELATEYWGEVVIILEKKLQ